MTLTMRTSEVKETFPYLRLEVNKEVNIHPFQQKGLNVRWKSLNMSRKGLNMGRKGFEDGLERFKYGS